MLQNLSVRPDKNDSASSEYITIGVAISESFDTTVVSFYASRYGIKYASTRLYLKTALAPTAALALVHHSNRYVSVLHLSALFTAVIR